MTDNLSTAPILKKVGIVLIVLSFTLYACILLVPFIPYSLGTKAIITTTLFIGGEVAFWVGCLILGREIVMKYRKYLDPRHWFKKKTNTDCED